MSRKVDYLQSVLVKLSQDGYKTIHGTNKKGQVRISKMSYNNVDDDICKLRDDDLYIDAAKIFGLPIPKSEKYKHAISIQYELESIDWSKVPKNTPIIVWNGDLDPKPRNRHFCGYDKKSNKVIAYEGGTSWTAHDQQTYLHAILAKDKEIEKFFKGK